MTTFTTRNLHVAAYLLTLGAGYPTTKTEDPRGGLATFEFEDPEGEWRRECGKLNLSDSQSDACQVPCARFLAAWKMLKEDMNKALGREGRR